MIGGDASSRQYVTMAGAGCSWPAQIALSDQRPNTWLPLPDPQPTPETKAFEDDRHGDDGGCKQGDHHRPPRITIETSVVEA